MAHIRHSRPEASPGFFPSSLGSEKNAHKAPRLLLLKMQEGGKRAKTCGPSRGCRPAARAASARTRSAAPFTKIRIRCELGDIRLILVFAVYLVIYDPAQVAPRHLLVWCDLFRAPRPESGLGCLKRAIFTRLGKGGNVLGVSAISYERGTPVGQLPLPARSSSQFGAQGAHLRQLQ